MKWSSLVKYSSHGVAVAQKTAGLGEVLMATTILCIMVVLRSLSYPCAFKELVGIFGLPSNRISDVYQTAIEFIYFKYRKLVAFESWVPYFSQFADIFSEYGLSRTKLR